MPRRPSLDGEAFPPIELLIPHRGSARLLEGIVARAGEGLTALAAVPADHPLAADGCAPTTLTLEMAAQAAAALAALAHGGAAAPRQGYLVGARHATFHRPFLTAGERLHVTVTPSGSAPPLAVYDFTVHAAEALVATGVISTYSL
jgi:predicted hotdog family 3-hydroxylacyl-ACP dehydratase